MLSRLDEQQCRWYVAVEANRIGHGGIRLLSQITGLDEKTIQRGQQDLEHGLAERPIDHVRMTAGGRSPGRKTDPAIETALQAIVTPEAAGEPMSLSGTKLSGGWSSDLGNLATTFSYNLFRIQPEHFQGSPA